MWAVPWAELVEPQWELQSEQLSEAQSAPQLVHLPVSQSELQLDLPSARMGAVPWARPREPRDE